MCFGANGWQRAGVAMSFPSRLPSTDGCKSTASTRTALLPEDRTILLLQETETRLLVDLQKKIADEINRMLPEPYPETDRLKLLARVQHFHGRTNLIDFTRDCLVALFFACYDREGEESGGGWTGGDGRIVFLPEDDATIVDAPIGDSRAIAQRSVFCVENCGDSARGFI